MTKERAQRRRFMDKLPLISIVVPGKDEEDSLPVLYEKISATLEKITERYELILVNDGSTDGTEAVIESLHKKDARVKGIELQKNFGQTAALAAGIDMAQGEIIITMDADLQNDPADIPRLLDKLNEGYDIVSGWRKDRKDRMLSRKIPSKIANYLISKVTEVPIHDLGCALKAYRKEVVKDLRLYGDMHRYLAIYSSMNGAKIAEIVVNHHARQFGTAHYGISRTMKVVVDLITIHFFLRFLTKPMRMFGSIGILSFSAGTLIGVYLTAVKILEGVKIGDRPLLLLAVLLIVVGIQFIGLGILGELVARVYFESGDRKTYAVRKMIQ